jgi:hypothetical protein
MWINFEASRPFAVKVFLGGINAVSGESSNEDMATRLRRNTLLSQGQSVQDYVVPPRQQWLDGVAKSDGRVMQFVAAPMGNGYSVEAQMTGKDSVGGLQFEVIPLKVRTLGNLDNQADPTHLSIKVKNPQGDEMHFKMKPTTTLSKLMDAFCQRENLSGSATKSYHIDAQNHHRIQPSILPSFLRFKAIPLIMSSGYLRVYRFKACKSKISTSSCHIPNAYNQGAVILVRLEQLGGGGPSPVRATEMSLAPGGLIKQTIIKDDIPAGEWDVDSAILVNVQLINAVIFKTITGVTPPKTPISATTYAKHGFPFYETYKEPSGVVGGLRSLKSVGEMDMEKKQNLAGHKAEKNLGFPLVTLAGTKRSFVPVGEMEKTLKKVRVANSL